MGQRTGDSIFESPVVAGEMWYAARESNPQPAEYKLYVCRRYSLLLINDQYVR